MFIHLFSIRAEMFEPPSVDSLYVIDDSDVLVMMDTQTYDAAKELSHVPEEVERKRSLINNYVKYTELRIRMDQAMYPRILRLDVDEELSFDDLDRVIQTYPADRLKAKLKSWEFKV